MTSHFTPLTPNERGRLAELRIRDNMQTREHSSVWENLFVMVTVGTMNGALVFAINRSLALSLAVGGLSAVVMLFALVLGWAAFDS